MTVQKAIRTADDMKPNAFSDETKTQWLNDVEGMVQTQVLLFAAEEIVTYDCETDMDAELLVQPPHDKLYWSYLVAMIDFANGEYDRYQNTMQMFNAHFAEFTQWFADNYRPADTHGRLYHNEELTYIGGEAE